jgi:hypothetical protein
MLKISVITTDQTFVKDLNSAAIEGVRADHRPTMAYDSAEHVLEIVITAATSVGLKLVADWLLARLKNAPPPTQLTINSQTINAENVVTVINNYIDAQPTPKAPDKKTPE